MRKMLSFVRRQVTVRRLVFLAAVLYLLTADAVRRRMRTATM